MNRIFCILSVIFLGCNSNTSFNHAEHRKQDTINALPQQKSVEANPVIKDDLLNAIYPFYVKLTAALVNKDVVNAKLAAGAIEAGASAITDGATIKKYAAAIMNASLIEEQRTAYEQLSKYYLAMIKKSGLSSGALYIANCPMAFNDKGASWLSSDKTIRNPYFGDEMLTCGFIEDTIK